MAKKVLVITGDAIAPSISGPGIRALKIAEQLSKSNDVRVVSTLKYLPVEAPFFVGKATGHELKKHVSWAEVIIFQGFVLAQNHWIKRSRALLVADLYDPLHLEHLEDADLENEKISSREIRHTLAVLTEQIRCADFILCASEKQRDFWLGYLSAVGRVDVPNYLQDSSLRELIDVVPFGLSAEKPQQSRHALREGVSGIDHDSFVLIWGGGIYNWFDPLTLIRAVAQLSNRYPQLKLFFMASAHPNPLVAKSKMANQAIALADELGVLGTSVIFNKEWIPFDERSEYLLDANIGVSTHFSHLETDFSFRTRMLDYLWTNLPMISSAGDTFADLIEQYNLGIAVPTEDVDALASAIARYLEQPHLVAEALPGIQKLASELSWENVVKPLEAFINRGRPAPDILGTRPGRINSIPTTVVRESWIRGKMRGMKIAFRDGGLKSVMSKIGSRFTR